ncbi:MAG: hypothetical protein L3J35_09140 [Bacteroidales bacterium]|nr:hypothetical protein [Bacteroidales bacterium]
MALRLPKFIKLPNHSRFEYKPLYYDKRKEELEKKVNKYKEQKELLQKGEYKPEIKGKFNRSYNHGDTKKQKKAANIRLAIIVFFTAAIVYIILQKAEILNKMLNVLISG